MRVTKALKLLVLVGCTAAISGCTTLLRTEISKERSLLEADRAFAQSALTQGGAAAMRTMMATTASMLARKEGEYIGADQAALAYPTPAGTDQDVIYWSPEKAWVSGDDSLGVTTGRFVRTLNGVQREQGRYSTVWRRDAQGSWRAELALLGDDTPPPPPAPPVVTRPTTPPPTPTPPRKR